MHTALLKKRLQEIRAAGHRAQNMSTGIAAVPVPAVPPVTELLKRGSDRTVVVFTPAGQDRCEAGVLQGASPKHEANSL